MANNRKKFIQQLGAGLIMTGLPTIGSAGDIFDPVIDINDFKNEGAADDEKYWKNITHKYYIISKDEFYVENMRMPQQSTGWDVTGRMKYVKKNKLQ